MSDSRRGWNFERAARTFALHAGCLLTAAVSVVAPRRAAQMDYERAQWMSARGYEAAAISRFTGGIQFTQQNSDSMLNARRNRLAGITREQIANNPTANGLLQTHCNNVIGDGDVGMGMTIDPAIVAADESDAAKAAAKADNSALKRLWKRYKDRLDFGGRLGFPDLSRALNVSLVVNGEALAVMRDTAGAAVRSGRFAFSVQVYESDRLPMNAEMTMLGTCDSGSYGRTSTGLTFTPTGAAQPNLLLHGIEYSNGKPIFYHIRDVHPGDESQLAVRPHFLRIAARDVIHYFRMDRPEQTRGVTRFASILDTMRQTDDLEYSELLAAQAQAYFGLHFEGSSQPGIDPAMPTDTAGKPLSTFHPGMITVGKKAEFYQSARPGGTFLPFVQSLLRKVAKGFGIGYSGASGDYSMGAYSALSREQNEERRGYDADQGLHVRHFCRPVWERFVRACLVAGLWQPAAGMAAFARDPEAYFDCVVHLPGAKHINPKQEAEAQAIGLANGTLVLDEISSESGLEPEERIQRMGALAKQARDQGLKFAWMEAAPAQPSEDVPGVDGGVAA